MANQKTHTLEFSSSALPSLAAGKYDIDISQTIESGKKKETFSLKKKFEVSSERLNFHNEEILAVYPPDLSSGKFYGMFPAVVFRRRALPWERSLEAVGETLDGTYSWLAVLLFNNDENPPAVKKRTLDEWAALKTQGYLLDPKIATRSATETGNTYCNTIDLPVTEFQRIAPTLNDMKYVAHVRHMVDVVDAVQKPPYVGQDVYSVVIGNRVVKRNEAAVAYLVSLENMAAYLPAEREADGSSAPGGNTDSTAQVSLICYQSWQFAEVSGDDNENDSIFEELFKKINSGQPDKKLTTLQFPFRDDTYSNAVPPSRDDVQRAYQELETIQSLTDSARAKNLEILACNALGQGYIPLSYKMHSRMVSVAWYRGPCAPKPIVYPIGKYRMLRSADRANFYDPELGLFDVSYGAAWQLGQLLALENKIYAGTISHWKNKVNQNIANRSRDTVFLRALGVDGFIPNADEEQTAGTSASANEVGVALDSLPNIPEDAVYWLTQLIALYHIPFNYLVPHESMLPRESLRFFYLDNNWINCLIDGAFSLNRIHSKQEKLDKILSQKLHRAIRSQKSALRAGQEGTLYYENADQIHTGFLLRSELVSTFQNMRVNGYRDAAPVQKLRLQQLSSDYLICIFDGDVNKIVFDEPIEQIECGLNVRNEVASINLRRLPDGEPISESQPLLIPMGSDKQLVQLDKAAADIKAALKSQGVFGAAELALEIIRKSVRVEFSIKS